MKPYQVLLREHRCDAITDGIYIANRFNNLFFIIEVSLTSYPVSGKKPSDFIPQDDLAIFQLCPASKEVADKIISNFRYSAAAWDEFKPIIIVPKIHQNK